MCNINHYLCLKTKIYNADSEIYGSDSEGHLQKFRKAPTQPPPEGGAMLCR